MLPLFKAFCFFCILLLGSVLIRGNNNLISPAVRQEFFLSKKTTPSFYQKIDACFSNVNLDFTYKSVDYSASTILQYIRRLIRKLYIK
ncbi:hypothetical protein EKQ06_22940 [Escherichia coli]|nr:hypothetical protein [Escherichia coli]EFB2787136.1 hypothetical protein [Escherichia coli]EFN9781900.1 hypothetical protein [Escherichia coli]EFO1397373.1 hypothetical protein [Escherichia coli]KAA1376996.1 hypothetical protein F1E12_20515 [Escherichia coli]